MIERVVIFRSSNRPKYVERSLPALFERTNINTGVIFFDNSEPEYIKSVEKVAENIYEKYEVVKNFDVIYHYEGKRIGGPNAIMKGIRLAMARWPNVKYIMVCDDDVLVPSPQERSAKLVYWDDQLAEMLDAGWHIVAHPWTNDFRDGKTKIINGVEGYRYEGVGGGCSAFKLDLCIEHPITQSTLIRGYNEWMVRCSNKYGINCGYSAGDMIIEHFDRPDHPWSLRDTEYCDWSDEMYYERFPKAKEQGKARPKGKDGVW